mgnify:CR=1 FL=1
MHYMFITPVRHAAACTKKEMIMLWGFDPGKHTGVAKFNAETQRLVFVKTMPVHRALLMLWQERDTISAVYCEDPNTFVPFKGVSQREINARKQGAGSIKRDFTILKDACGDYGIKFIPTRLQGSMKKMTPEQFNKITGWVGRTSNHARDAACLVIGRRK